MALSTSVAHQGTSRRHIFVGRLKVPALATGASLTAFTVMAIVAMLLSTEPSLALKVKVAVQEELAAGV